MMKKIAALLVSVAVILSSGVAVAQGTVPIALQTVVDQTGRPIAGALLYFYQAGTVATRQDSFQDTGLTQVNQWPLPTDAFGRVPMFYVASGSVHIRLTDAGGAPIYENLNMLVIGPVGGGGGGAAVDPTTLFTTGDMKFRPTVETLTGWVKANGQTIGSATSGATGRANADTQNLFISLWNNCLNTHCPVSGGRGASGLADFNANKAIGVYDCRGRVCGLGIDDMGNSAAGFLSSLNITSAGDNQFAPAAQAGQNLEAITQAQLPSYTLPTGTAAAQSVTIACGGTNCNGIPNGTTATGFQSGSSSTVFITGFYTGISATASPSNVTISSGGSGQQINVTTGALTGTWYIKL